MGTERLQNDLKRCLEKGGNIILQGGLKKLALPEESQCRVSLAMKAVQSIGKVPAVVSLKAGYRKPGWMTEKKLFQHADTVTIIFPLEEAEPELVLLMMRATEWAQEGQFIGIVSEGTNLRDFEERTMAFRWLQSHCWTIDTETYEEKEMVTV